MNKIVLTKRHCTFFAQRTINDTGNALMVTDVKKYHKSDCKVDGVEAISWNDGRNVTMNLCRKHYLRYQKIGLPERRVKILLHALTY